MPETQPALTQRRERNDCVKAKRILCKNFKTPNVVEGTESILKKRERSPLSPSFNIRHIRSKKLETTAIGRTIRTRNGHPKVLATYSLCNKNLDTIRFETTSVPGAATSAQFVPDVFQSTVNIFNIAFTKH